MGLVLRCIACILVALSAPLWAKDETLRTAQGEEFVRACEDLLKPLHCPEPGLFDSTNQVLLGRLPSLGGAEREACLKALARTADDRGVVANKLCEMWKSETPARRETMIHALARAMVAAERFQNAGMVWDALVDADFGGLDEFAFGALGSLLHRAGPREEVRLLLDVHCLDQVLRGRIEPYRLRSALTFMDTMRPVEPNLKRLVNAGLRDERALEGLAALPPTKGTARLLVMRLSDGNRAIRDVARRQYAALPEELKGSLDPDTYYVEQLRSGSHPSYLPGLSPRQGSAVIYMASELAVDAQPFVDRLKAKGVRLGASDVRALVSSGVAESVLEPLKAR
jgi:hypothetical protein